METHGLNHSADGDAITVMERGDDFLSGCIWIDTAVRMAYNEFANYSSAGRSKMIIMITDGNPTGGHEPFQNLQSVKVIIVGVGVEGSSPIDADFFSCIISDPSYYFNVEGFGKFTIFNKYYNDFSIIADGEGLVQIWMG